MKRSTVNSSMRRTTKIITLMLIITVAVGLLPLVSTTVDAASYDYNYITCLTDASGNSTVYLSQDPIHVYCAARDMTSYGGSYYYFLGSSTDKNLVELVYSTSLNQWVTNAIRTPGELNGISTIYIMDTRTGGDRGSFVTLYGGVGSSSFYQLFSCITNGSMNSTERNAFTSWSGDISSLPEGLTEERVNEIIDEQINTSTSSGQAAQTIINNTTNQYSLYITGDISSAQMQQNVTDNIDALNDLTPSTLLDAMQINNGLTYNQTIQDSLLNTTSGNVSSTIAQTLTDVNKWRQWCVFDKSVDDNVAVEQINIRLKVLSDLLINGAATTTADINAVNAAINYINSVQTEIENNNDLSEDVANKSQASDAEELALLNEMVLAMQDEEIDNPMQNQQTMSDAQTVRDSISDIWVNKYMVALTAMFGMLVIPCILLRTHYRMM